MLGHGLCRLNRLYGFSDMFGTDLCLGTLECNTRKYSFYTRKLKEELYVFLFHMYSQDYLTNMMCKSDITCYCRRYVIEIVSFTLVQSDGIHRKGLKSYGAANM